MADGYEYRCVDFTHIYRDHGPHFSRPYPDDAAIATGPSVRTLGDQTYRNDYPLPITAPVPRFTRPAIPQMETTEDEVSPVASSVIPTVVDADPGDTEVQLDRSEL